MRLDPRLDLAIELLHSLDAVAPGTNAYSNKSLDSPADSSQKMQLKL